MTVENIDYEDLKRRGFLRQKQEGFFVLRTRMTHGVYSKEQINALAEIASTDARGILHATTRQGLEIPFIKFEDIPLVEKKLKLAGIDPGTSGPRLRTTTACPGNNWCKQGLVDTFALSQRIEEELGIKCGLDLPHKFKIAISGCPNSCTRPQAAEIGIHGTAGGYVVYLGGCAGRLPRAGFKLERVLNEEEVLRLVKKTVNFFRNNAKPKQRLWVLIDEVGKENFLKEILS